VLIELNLFTLKYSLMVRDKFRAYLNLKKKAVLTSPDLETV